MVCAYHFFPGNLTTLHIRMILRQFCLLDLKRRYRSASRALEISMVWYSIMAGAGEWATFYHGGAGEWAGYSLYFSRTGNRWDSAKRDVATGGCSSNDNEVADIVPIPMHVESFCPRCQKTSLPNPMSTKRQAATASVPSSLLPFAINQNSGAISSTHLLGDYLRIILLLFFSIYSSASLSFIFSK